MDRQYQWEMYLPLVEFAYNNSYRSTIKMARFEALYGCKCRTPVSWNRVEDKIIVGPEMLKEMEEQIIQIRQRLKEANDRQKSYADAKRTPREFSVGEKVLLKVKPQKSTMKFGKRAKLVPRYVGPFEVMEIMNPVAYRIALPSVLARMHDVFHVSYLKKYITHRDDIIDWNLLQV